RSPAWPDTIRWDGLRALAEGESAPEKARGFHGRIRLSERADVSRPGEDRRSLEPAGGRRRTEVEGPVGGAVEPLPSRVGPWRRPHQPGERAPLRNHGPRPLGPRGLQLLGPGYREHGDPRPLRDAGTEGSMAASAAEWRNPFRVRDDRTRCRLL